MKKKNDNFKMSGSTENLLRNSHLSASKESLDGHYYGTQARQTKGENQGKTQGMENKGFQDDHRGLEPSSTSEINFSYEPQSYQKRATSLQQRPVSSSSKEPRRHSSPDHSSHLRQEKIRSRHGARRRLSSNIEEDLRRKACLNSMKRHQSANPLPVSGQEEYSYVPVTAQDKGRESYSEDREKIQNLDEDRGSERSSMHHDTRNQIEPPLEYGSSQQQYNEVQNMQQTIIALEKNQLQQYKKRLTLALSERAKLTEELQVLSQSLTPRELEIDRRFSESISLGSSLGHSPSSARSARLSYSLGDLKVPEMYGDDGDISVDYENKLRLPPVPGSAQSSRKKMEIPELDLRSLNSSFERVSSDHMENLPKEKGFEKNKETQPLKGGNEGNNENYGEKEEFKKMVEDIWQDNLRGDVLAQERREEKREDNIVDENARDVNNNEKTTKKRLTVEEFLTNGDSKKQPNEKEKIQPQRELSILHGSYEDMNGQSRETSPELYEPVECLFRSQTTQGNDREQQQNTPPIDHGQGLLRLKVDHEKNHDEGNLEKYFTASTLPVEKKENRKRDDRYVNEKEGKTSLKPLGEKATLSENQLPRTSGIGRLGNERRFNYMIPPGTRLNVAASSGNKNENFGRNEREKGTGREVERVPSNISEKLRYYREKLSNRVEEESSHDLADAYAREKDPEKKREIQQQAASEAAILRREASALLFEAMNLERICDPNGRVKHVYLPH